MSDFILSTPITEWTEESPQPSSSFLITEYEGRQAYLWTGDNPVGIWDSYYVVGEWDTITGAPLTVIHPDYGDFIARFGNNEGRATADKLSPLWQGHSQEKLYLYDDTDPEDVVRQLYPDDDSPFGLQIFRVYHEGDTPEYPVAGWGWTVRVLSDDPARDVTARAISRHSATPCSDANYIFTTGSINLNPDNGFYETYCPPGNLDPNDIELPFALRFGSGYEGWFVLPENSTETESLFWSHDAVGEGVQEWSGLSVPYAIGDHVMYLDIEYECIQAHTSQPAWTPPAVASLWAVV